MLDAGGFGNAPQDKGHAMRAVDRASRWRGRRRRRCPAGMLPVGPFDALRPDPATAVPLAVGPVVTSTIRDVVQ
jgi:hypothetical protein